MALFLLCKTVEHTCLGCAHSLHVRSPCISQGLLFWLGNEAVTHRTAAVVLSALFFFAVITKLYLLYTVGFLFPDAIMFTSAQWPVLLCVSLHVVTMMRMSVRAVAPITSVKGWSHADLVCECIGVISVTRLPFQKLRCEHQKKHFLS